MKMVISLRIEIFKKGILKRLVLVFLAGHQRYSFSKDGHNRDKAKQQKCQHNAQDFMKTTATSKM